MCEVVCHGLFFAGFEEKVHNNTTYQKDNLKLYMNVKLEKAPGKVARDRFANLPSNINTYRSNFPYVSTHIHMYTYGSIWW